jgi:hypothetical protein
MLNLVCHPMRSSDNASQYDSLHTHTNFPADILGTTEAFTFALAAIVEKRFILAAGGFIFAILGLSSPVVSLGGVPGGKGLEVYGHAAFGIIWFVIATLLREEVYSTLFKWSGCG